MLRSHSRWLSLAGSALMVLGCRSGASGVASRPEWPTEASERMTAGKIPADDSFTQSQTPYGRQPAGRMEDGLRNSGVAGGASSEKQEFDAVAEHLTEARAANARGNLEQAKLHYRRVLQDVPNHHEAHHRLAVIADKQQRFSEAETHYLAALRARPRDVDVRSDLGYSYLLQGRYPECQQTLDEAIRIDARHVRANNNLGLLYGKLGKYDLALAAFQRTSSEAEARQKMMKLFPDADPGPVIATSNDPRTPTPRGIGSAGPAGIDAASYVAQERPENRATGYGPAEVPPDADRPSGNDLTQRIKADMERARQEALAGRDAQNRRKGSPATSPIGGINPGAEKPANSVSASPSGPSMGHGSIMASGEQTPTRYQRHVPDRDLGKRIAEIDGLSAPKSEVMPPSRPTSMNRTMPAGSGGPQRAVHFAGRERRESVPVRNARPDAQVDESTDVWPPQDQLPAASETILPVHYSQTSRDPRNPNFRANSEQAMRGANTMTPEEAQRMATRIALEAGPGGMWNYLDQSGSSNPNRQGNSVAQPEAWNDPQRPLNYDPRKLQAAGAGYLPNLTSPPKTSQWNGEGEGFPGPGAQRDPRQLPAMGPNSSQDPRAIGSHMTAEYMQSANPAAGQSWREPGVTQEDDMTMPYPDPSAVNMSYQDHVNQANLYDATPADEREYQAILSEIKRNQQPPPSAWSQMPVVGHEGQGSSSQYYSPMDSQLQIYEEMRAASREGYQAQPGQSQNPTGMHENLRNGPISRNANNAMNSQGGFGQPGGVSPWGTNRR